MRKNDSPPPRKGRGRLDSILAIPSRRWVILLPVHLFAFLILYLSVLYLLNDVVLTAGQEGAVFALRHEVDELGLTVLDHQGKPGHAFRNYIRTHESLNFLIFNSDGQLLAGNPTSAEAVQNSVLQFIRDEQPSRAWHESMNGRDDIRILGRIVAGPRCLHCHTDGQFLGVISQSLDLTTQVGALHTTLWRSLALLILAWSLLVILLTMLVGRSIKRSVARLEADLEAARSGQGPSETEASQLMLDPVSAQLHQSVRTFLEQQRERDVDMSSRLEHSDQLASTGKLAAGLAHEIKNPLAGIQSALEILREDTADDKNRALCTEMLSEMQRVNQTLQLLLSSVRPSPPRLATTDVRNMLEEIRRLTEPAMRQKKISYKLEIAPGRLQCRIDEAKIRQVLVNLIGNASEALETGGEIIVRAAGLEEQGGVIITVEDNGPGIPEEVRRKIFEPFFTTKFTGTGLGLAIAKRLVDQHGGSLKVQSEPSIGTTFFVVLPATESISTASQEE